MAERRPFLLSAALFLGLAVLLNLYVFVEPRTHASFWIDYVWATQFTEQLQAGDSYPRWLERSYGGLGSPAFLFYAPLSFYLVAAIAMLGLAVWPAIVIAGILLHAASGVAMRQWLLRFGEKPALAGALIYMALPYHVIDFGRRGAIAEFAAFVFLPIVAAGIRRAAEGRGSVLLAVAYAGLILSHLPVALLTTLFLVPVLALRHFSLRSLLAIGAGGALGLALAAIYLVPAVLLQHHINPALWARHFTPEHWVIWNILKWEEPRETWLIAAAILGALGAAVLLIWRQGVSYWPLVTIGLCLLAANVTPFLWSLSLLEKVQFPWRAMTLVDFALATAMAAAVRNGVSWRWAAFALGPLALLTVAVMLLPLPDGPHTIAELNRDFPDVAEYRRENLPDNGRAMIMGEAAPIILISQWISLLALAVTALLAWREHRRPSDT